MLNMHTTTNAEFSNDYNISALIGNQYISSFFQQKPETINFEGNR